jgi:hypothetical protein
MAKFKLPENFIDVTAKAISETIVIVGATAIKLDRPEAHQKPNSDLTDPTLPNRKAWSATKRSYTRACRARSSGAECVLKRGDGIDRVLGDVLRDFPNMSLQEAIEALSAQGWWHAFPRPGPRDRPRRMIVNFWCSRLLYCLIAWQTHPN